MFHLTNSFMLRHLNPSKVMRCFAHFELTDSSSSPSSSSSIESTGNQRVTSSSSPVTRATFSTNQENMQNEFLEYFVRMKVSTKKATHEELKILSELEKQAGKGDEAKKNYIKLVKEISRRPKKN